MEDHIFGTFSTDELKFLHERVSAMGLQHRVRTIPRDPAPGEPITLLVTSGPDFPAQEVVAYYTTDGSAPTPESATLSFVPAHRHWSTVGWGYLTEWRAQLPGQPSGTLLRYRIAGRSTEGDWHWADWPEPKLAVEQALIRGEESDLLTLPGTGSDFALSIDELAPPAWAEGAIIYQLFLDRFARDEDEPWPTPPSLFDIYGGTLRGATRKLDYIARLGANCIWLSPIFPSPTHHGYDATDYYDVEPRLGSREELKRFVDRAHELGIRVLLDFICNHVSNEHPAFQKALADPTSEERGWFWIGPDFAPHGYRSFFNVASMPELNTDHPAVREYLIGAAEMWVREYGIDGFRLDYAHGPSHAFWTTFWRAMKRVNPDVWCFGEIVDTPENQLSYLGRLDGVLDFHLGDGLRRVFAHETLDLIWLDHFLRDNNAFFPPLARFSRPAFLDNHDMDRFHFLVQGSEKKLRLASMVLYTLPNPPLLYYGTEIALEQRYSKSDGYGLEVSREPMQWERVEERADLLAFFRRLGTLRRDEPAMRPTERRTLHVARDRYLALHIHGESELLLALNRAEAPVTLRHEQLRGTFCDLLTERPIELEGALDLEGIDGRLLRRL